MILFENRASIVLYNVLKTFTDNRKFLLPLNVCPIVPDTFKKANIEFEFIDINLTTLCMDESIILEKIKKDKEINGLLFVKTFGIDIDVEPLFKEIKSINRDLFIIDDMCPSIQYFDYNIDDSYADLALFSSGYSKYVDIGYGGYGFLKDNDFKNIFIDKRESLEFIEYQDKVEKEIALMKVHKEELNSIYKSILPEDIFIGEQFNNWRFSILVDNKDEILTEIFKIEGLFASSHYPQVDFDYVSNPMQNSNTKKIHDRIINLFNDFRFTKEKAYLVSEIVTKRLRRR